MKKGLCLVVLALGVIGAMSGCCSCEKGTGSSGWTPTASAQDAPMPVSGSPASYSGYRAVK